LCGQKSTVNLKPIGNLSFQPDTSTGCDEMC